MRFAAAVLVGVLLAGCASLEAPPAPEDEWRALACAHPWPCGDGSEWPLELATPAEGFPLAELVPIRVPMDDGVELDGAVWLPDVPEGVRVPVVLWATPYAGQCRYSRVTGGSPSCDEEPAGDEGMAEEFAFLVAEGYAAAMVSMRGTGLSGGCFDFYGARGQQDMVALVEWLAAQDWSNGRVGMWGVSAMGTAPWMAAIHQPPSLKAIAPSGIVSDLYLNRYTPQGVTRPEMILFHAGWAGFNSVVPAGGALPTASSELPRLGTIAQAQATRWCEGLPETLAAPTADQVSDERAPAFWEERRLVARFGDVTAAALVLQGFGDTGHAFQDDLVWNALGDAPKRMLLGPWGHTPVFDEHLGEYVGGNASHGIYLEWFDFWLKGRGAPPRLGVVDLHAGDSWRTSTAWPPADAREEALHLAGDRLAPAPGEGASSFRAVAAPAPGCEGEGGQEGTFLLYVGEPLAEDATLAGNPYALLEVASDQAGGILALDLYERRADGSCVRVSIGGADLRYHHGGPRAQPFPIDAPTPVRIDLYGTGHALAAGSRLVVALSAAGDPGFLGSPQHAPTLRIGGASQLVLPLVHGTLGGGAPAGEPPPRPRS